MDVWGPARVQGQGRERYFLLVVDDYTRYTTVFPLQRKGQVPDVLIPWIRAVRLQLRERFHSDFPILRLHSDRGGEFTSDLLRAFCEEHGFRQTFTLPASPQQNGVAERRIGLVMEVARTSLIHAAAPHFLWPFAVRYAAHQLNLWPRVSLPKTSLTLRWTGEVGDASPFRSGVLVPCPRSHCEQALCSRHSRCLLGFPPDAPGWQFYDPTLRRVFASQDVTFDESVPFYRPFPTALALSPPRRSFSLQVLPRGAEPGGAEPGGRSVSVREEPGGAESGGAEPAREESGGAESGGAESGGAAPEGTETAGARSPWSGRLRPRVPLTSQQLHDWYGHRQGRATGVRGSAAGGASADVAGAGSGTGPLSTGGAGFASPGGARTGGTGAAGTGGAVSGGAAAGDTATGDPGTGGAGSGGAAAGDTEAGDPGTGGAGSGGAAAGGAGPGGAGAGGSGAAGGAGGAGG
ncbi:unnamed protein product, partial [Closterium sp. Yama58-4]